MKTACNPFLALAAALLVAIAIPVSLAAQGEEAAPVQHGPHFVDLNGDGFNDNAPDHNGNGVPNGKDPSWAPPRDGSGAQMRLENRAGGVGGQGKGRSIQSERRGDGSGPKGQGARDGQGGGGGPKNLGSGKGRQ